MSNFMNAKNIIEACKRQMKIIEEKQKTMQECEELYDLEDILLLLECTVEVLSATIPRETAKCNPTEADGFKDGLGYECVLAYDVEIKSWESTEYEQINYLPEKYPLWIRLPMPAAPEEPT